LFENTLSLFILTNIFKEVHQILIKVSGLFTLYLHELLSLQFLNFHSHLCR